MPEDSDQQSVSALIATSSGFPKRQLWPEFRYLISGFGHLATAPPPAHPFCRVPEVRCQRSEWKLTVASLPAIAKRLCLAQI
jgi:hypothetical protein